MTGRDPRAVAAGYDAAAAGYDARHDDDAATRARTRRIDRALLDAIGGAARVLEIGVGTGRLLAQVRAPLRLGVDVSAGMLAHARARGLEVVRADGHALPLRDRSVDAVIAGKGALRYLDPARALPELARVLAPGGTLAFHLYGRPWSRRPAPPAPALWQPRTLAELDAPLAAAGFTIVARTAWRSIRAWPYALRVPVAIATRAPLWSHVAIVARLSARR